MRSAAEELVGILADEGVEHLFFNPGTDTAPVQEALAAARESGLPHPRAVLCLHEHVALSAALGHHFLSGRPQALMVHVDAGTLNLGGALHNAQRNRAPVVVLAGRSPYSSDPEVPGHRDSPIHWQQEQPDQAAAMRAYGKWTMEVPRGRELGAILRRAFQVARSDPAGPVYVMLPREALMEPAAAVPPAGLVSPRPAHPEPQALDELCRMLGAAERPVIVTGRTGRDPRSVPVLVEIAELLGAPLLETRDRLNFPPRHPLYAGPEGDAFLREADCVLVLDSEVPWVPAVAAPPAGARVAQIDVDCLKSTMPNWSFPIGLAITASTATALPLLRDRLCADGAAERGRWADRRARVERRVGELHASWRRRAASGAAADAADSFLAALDQALPPEAILLEEAVTNRPAVLRQVAREPGLFFGSGAPSLGWAVGAGLGARLARPEAPVVALCGDGSFNFGVPTAALWSAAHAGAPFISVILDNRAYYASRRPVERLYPAGAAVRNRDFPETDLEPALDYVAMAAACGASGEEVADPGRLGPALQRALEATGSGRCAVIDIRLPSP